MIYSFFAADDTGRPGLGNFIIMDHILRARDAGLPYVYLGYWVKGSARMAYKVRFPPDRDAGPRGWRLMEPEAQPVSAAQQAALQANWRRVMPLGRASDRRRATLTDPSPRTCSGVHRAAPSPFRASIDWPCGIMDPGAKSGVPAYFVARPANPTARPLFLQRHHHVDVQYLRPDAQPRSGDGGGARRIKRDRDADMILLRALPVLGSNPTQPRPSTYASAQPCGVGWCSPSASR